jgi:ubiquinone/menaquinone biosynthesis C-methylase UbiE
VTRGNGQATAAAKPPGRAWPKRQRRSIWEAGDFARIAELGPLAVGVDLVDRVGIRPGVDVLDVATGTGNAAIPAAAAGARVTGLDIAPLLLDIARRRARNRGLEIEWVEGDAENLPFPDGRFECVLSTFGVQFAPRHRVAAHELARVCALGGVIGLANWTPHAAPARVLATVDSYLPSSAAGDPPPLWGVEAHVRHVFAGTGVELEFDESVVYFEHAGSTQDFVDFYATYFGPLAVAREQLSTDGRWNSLGDELVEIWGSVSESRAPTFRAPSEYLVAIGRKRRTPGSQVEVADTCPDGRAASRAKARRTRVGRSGAIPG